MLRYYDVVAFDLKFYAEALEAVGHYSEVVVAYVFHRYVTSRHCGHAYEAAYLDHVGEYAVGCAVKRFHAMDCQQIGADAFYLSTHSAQHSAQLLDIGLTSRIVYGRGAFCEDCGHDYVGCSGHRSLVEKHVGAFEFVGPDFVGVLLGVVFKFSSELVYTDEVGVEASAAYLVASGLGEYGVAETCHHGTHKHYRTAQRCRFLDVFGRGDVVEVYVGGLKRVGVGRNLLDFHSHLAKHRYEIVYVENIGDVLDYHLVGCQQGGTQYLQRFVLGSLRGDFSIKAVSAFDNECTHRYKGVKVFLFFLFLLGSGGCGSCLEFMKMICCRVKAYCSVAVHGQILEYLCVVDSVGIHGEHEFLHVVGDKPYKSVALLVVLHCSRLGYHQLYVFAVMTHLYRRQLIVYALGTAFQILGAYYVARIVYVKLEVAHYGQVVPQLVLEIVDIAQLRKQVAHRVDNRVGACGAFFPVLDCKAMVDHLLDVASVFGQYEFFKLSIVCKHFYRFC